VNNNPACDRLTVSAAFFGSPEFQLKGYFVYRFYKLAFNRPAALHRDSRRHALSNGTDSERSVSEEGGIFEWVCAAGGVYDYLWVNDECKLCLH
jgi:hypothetical protein